MTTMVSAHSADRDQQRPVGEQHVRGAAALLLLVHEVKIAEDPVQHEGDGPGPGGRSGTSPASRGPWCRTRRRSRRRPSPPRSSGRAGRGCTRPGSCGGRRRPSLRLVSSWRRLARVRNSASRIVQISSQSLICAPIATAPATARSTKPRLTQSTSTITTSFRRKRVERGSGPGRRPRRPRTVRPSSKRQRRGRRRPARPPTRPAARSGQRRRWRRAAAASTGCSRSRSTSATSLSR